MSQRLGLDTGDVTSTGSAWLALAPSPLTGGDILTSHNSRAVDTGADSLRDRTVDRFIARFRHGEPTCSTGRPRPGSFASRPSAVSRGMASAAASAA